MIARFRALLPFVLTVPVDEALAPFEFDWASYRVRVPSPLSLDVDPNTPLFVLLQQLGSSNVRSPTTALRVNGVPVFEANVLQLDFLSDSFDRTRSSWGAAGGDDPPASVLLAVANQVLDRIRVVTGAAWVRNLPPDSAVWRLRYLTDSEEELPFDPELRRGFGSIQSKFPLTVLTSGIWDTISGLPTYYSQPVWDKTLLDSEFLLPEVGPALVLAASALEALITTSLNLLAQRSTAPRDLWTWINDRPSWDQEPSVAERFDVLLRIFTGASLKDQPSYGKHFKTSGRRETSSLTKARQQSAGKLLTTSVLRNS